MDKLLKQIVKFGVVGVICFGIDYGLMVLLTELGGVNYLLSSGIAFSVSVTTNYLLSMWYVFCTRESGSKTREFTLFVILSVIGLLLTEALMWVGVEKLKFHYMLSKVGATGIVMVYNFVSRKVLLEGR